MSLKISLENLLKERPQKMSSKNLLKQSPNNVFKNLSKIKEMDDVFPISTENCDAIGAELEAAKKRIEGSCRRKDTATFGLVITGGSLTYALVEHRELFLKARVKFLLFMHFL